MHSGSLGVVLWLVGSIRCELVSECHLAGTSTQRVDLLWERIQSEYERLDIRNRLSQLKLSMFYHGPNDFACFTGKAG